jgi:hypothetical protein
MAVPTITYGSDIWIITTKREAKTEIAEMKFLRSVAGYTRNKQLNIKTRKELNIFNLNVKI